MEVLNKPKPQPKKDEKKKDDKKKDDKKKDESKDEGMNDVNENNSQGHHQHDGNGCCGGHEHKAENGEGNGHTNETGGMEDVKMWSVWSKIKIMNQSVIIDNYDKVR